jgi:hypothetical protein
MEFRTLLQNRENSLYVQECKPPYYLVHTPDKLTSLRRFKLTTLTLTLLLTFYGHLSPAETGQLLRFIHMPRGSLLNFCTYLVFL